MPRKLWAFSAEQLEIREYDLPEPEEGQVIVESEYGAAKHGTELPEADRVIAVEPLPNRRQAVKASGADPSSNIKLGAAFG